MPSLAEIREEISSKSGFLHKVFEQAGDDMDLSRVDLIDGDTTYKAGEIKRLNTELSDLGIERDRLENLESIGKLNEQNYKRMTEKSSDMVFPGAAAVGSPQSGNHRQAQKGLKQFLAEHKGYREFRADQSRSVQIDLPMADYKTLITLTTISPQNFRQPNLVEMALEERTVSDLMLAGTVDRSTVEYYEETTVTNAAATVAEGDSKPESALGYTLRTESVRKIAHWIPATKEALDDVSFLESQIRGRLAYGIRRIEETQLISGDGNAPNLRGILNRSGIQTQAKGSDPTPDTVYKGMQKVRGAASSGFAEPTALVIHPNDWTDIKLLRTSDGIYLWGNPSDEGPDRIWGMMVRQTTGITEGTGLLGAFRPHAEVLRREGITITLSTEHSTYFIENKVAILAEERVALACYRPSAFCQLTGI
jgi:HK97 family phage major capsid protein